MTQYDGYTKYSLQKESERKDRLIAELRKEIVEKDQQLQVYKPYKTIHYVSMVLVLAMIAVQLFHFDIAAMLVGSLAFLYGVKVEVGKILNEL